MKGVKLTSKAKRVEKLRTVPSQGQIPSQTSGIFENQLLLSTQNTCTPGSSRSTLETSISVPEKEMGKINIDWSDPFWSEFLSIRVPSPIASKHIEISQEAQSVIPNVQTQPEASIQEMCEILRVKYLNDPSMYKIRK